MTFGEALGCTSPGEYAQALRGQAPDNPPTGWHYSEGYLKGDFEDLWARYLPVAVTAVTAVTTVTREGPERTCVTDVTGVTVPPGLRNDPWNGFLDESENEPG